MGEVNFTNNRRQELALHSMFDYKYSLMYGGGRSGKTFVILYMIVHRAIEEKSRHAALRFHFSDIKKSVIMETWVELAAILELVEGRDFILNKQDWFIRFTNGSEIWFGGLDEGRGLDRILGKEYSTIWLNEASQISYKAFSIIKSRLAQKTGLKTKMFIDLNPTSKAHWTYTVFFLKMQPDGNELLNHPEQYGNVQMNPADNLSNIADDYLETMEGSTKADRERFLHGNYADIIKGSLFTQKMFNQHRVISHPELKEVVIVIDPAISTGEGADETGLGATGKGRDDRGYLLEDATDVYTPKEWAKKAIDLYHKWDASWIIYEENQGGDMIKATIQFIDENIPTKSVRATKGKLLRAEPVSALYDDGRISHVGSFVDAETEMVLYTGKPGQKSPNRLDFIVYGFLHLFPIGVFSDSELFNRDALKYWKDYDFENSTNLLYIKISSSTGRTPHYNFTALFVKIKDQKLFITDCIFNEMLPSDNLEQLKNKLTGFDAKRIFLECNPSFGAFFQELKQTKMDVRGIKEFNQEDNRIMSESAFIKESFVFEKNSESTYYKSYLIQLQSYTVSAEITESFAANILPSVAYVTKKLYKSLLTKKA